MQVISQSCKWIWMEFGMLLRLYGLISLMFFLSRPVTVNIQRRESNLSDFVHTNKHNNNVGVHADIDGPIPFTLVVMIDTTELYSLRKWKLLCSLFSQISQSNRMKFGMLPWPVGLFKLIFFFYPYEYYIDLSSESCSSALPSCVVKL